MFFYILQLIWEQNRTGLREKVDERDKKKEEREREWGRSEDIINEEMKRENRR